MSDLSVKLKLELQTAQGESALKRFETALDAALRKIGRTDAEIGIIKTLAREVEAGKRRLDELPQRWRADVAEIVRIGRGVRLLDETGIKQSHAAIRAEIDRLRQSFAELKSSNILARPELEQSAARVRDRIRELGEQMGSAHKHGQSLAAAMTRLHAAASLFLGAVAGSRISQMADEMQLLTARLALTEGSARAAKERLAELTAIANRAGVDMGAVADSYNSMADSVRKAGGSTADAVRMTEALVLALKISGASTTETANVMRQLGQALQKGRLNGDEFVTVAESGGKVLDYLAMSLGTTRGELARMAQEGELTTAKLLNLTQALDRIRQDAEGLPKTVGDAFARLTNAAKAWVAESQSMSVSMRALIGVIDFAAEHFGRLVDVLMLIGAGVIAANIGRVVAMLRTLGATLGIVAGMHPAVRAVMLALTGLTLLDQPIRRMWGALFGGGDGAAQRLQASIGEAKKSLELLSGQMANVGNAIGERMAEAKRRLDEVAQAAQKSARGLIDAMAQSMRDQFAAIDALARSRVQAIEASTSSESQKIRATVAVHVDAARQKAAAAEEAGRKMLAAWQASYDVLRRAAIASGRDVAEVERQATEERKRILDTLAQHYRSITDQLIAETQRHLDAARRADEELARHRMSTEDRVRALRQRTMDEAQAYADRVLQIEEKQAAARQALAQGDYDRARQLAEQAIQLAESNARAVTRRIEVNGQQVTQVVVSEAQATARAIEQITQSSAIVEAALKGQGDAHRSAAQQAQAAYESVARRLDEVVAAMDRLTAREISDLTVRVRVDTDAVQQRINEVKELAAKQEIVLRLKASAEEARAALEKNPISIEAQVKLQQVETAMRALREAQASDPLKVLAEVQIDDAARAIETLKQDSTSLHTVEPDTLRAQAAIDELRQPTSSTHTVYVQRVEQRASGGLIGGALAGFASGGQFVRRLGRITGPGTSTSDSIPAMLSAGEYVIRASSVRKYGVALLDAINRGVLPRVPRFAAGGLVHILQHAPAASSGATEVTLRLLDTQGDVRVRTSRDEAVSLARMLRRAGVRLAS